ncbi:MAG: AGE family epimerase/isomerase [Chitinophagia bacterium]|jgi:N-acylglucosamine 2-epimerase
MEKGLFHPMAPDTKTQEKYSDLYYNELRNNILPFWYNKSGDHEHGGYFTCLTREGDVFDTDKFIWLQGRQVWTFSTMYRVLDQKEEWKNFALQGAKFLQKHGRDQDGNWFFSLQRDGKPLTQAHNIFSDCFAAMGFSALHAISPNHEYEKIAADTFGNIISRQHDWKGRFSKTYPGTRPMKNFTLPMILCNLALEMEHILGKERVDALIPEVVDQVMNIFYRPEHGLIVENVSADNSLVDSFEGRILNPGHAIEAMWFIMDIGKRTGNMSLIKEAKKIMLNTLEYAWDHEHGGLFYFMDLYQKPMQQLEWDQKLWWVHVETLVALAKGFSYTGDQECMNWFDKVHTYTWEKFRDPQHGEWFGYLHRDGLPLNTAKGGKWKGCFHIPRGLLMVAKAFEASNNNLSQISSIA